jgi:hypothetical protein
VTIGLTADRGGPVLGECWEFGELSGCRMAQQSVTIMVDMHDLGDSMADAVRPLEPMVNTGPGRGLLGATQPRAALAWGGTTARARCTFRTDSKKEISSLARSSGATSGAK